jgi:hypothetical protein
MVELNNESFSWKCAVWLDKPEGYGAIGHGTNNFFIPLPWAGI